MFPLIKFPNFGGIDLFEVPDVQMDAWTDDEKLSLSLPLPGYEKGSISVVAEDGLLTVKAKREEKGDKKYLVKTSMSSYSQSISLPDGLDESKADATYENGVLTVTVPFVAQRKKLPIQVK